MKLKSDKSNVTFMGFIPDVINHRYRYIIEIDGSYHLKPEQAQRDKLKDDVFRRSGYKVFRLKAYSDACFQHLVQNVKRLRKSGKIRKGRGSRKKRNRLEKGSQQDNYCDKKAAIVDAIITKTEGETYDQR